LARPPSPHEDPTPTEDLGCEVQLVAQWVSTKGGAPALVFWDTGSQVTLVTQKMARALGLAAIPSSPLRLEGIGEGHRPWAAMRFKIPLVDTGGRTIAVTAYGVDVIMSPLVGGDAVLMRGTFPEVPAGGLVSASGEVSLLMGQDNFSLFPVERRRVGNATLYMSRFGTGWIASGRPPRAGGGGSTRLMGVCVIRVPEHGLTNRPELQEEDAAICAVSTVAPKWTAPPLLPPVNYISMVEAFKEGPHSTTPLRICMNSSLKQPYPVWLSLNDCLIKGPSALVDLFTVTLCVREHRYALTKDLSKFYQRVDANPVAQNLRRVMWRGGDTSAEMKVYITTTVNFGDKPAGCIAIAAVRETAALKGRVQRGCMVLAE
jgi:hypothetical protein